MSKFKYKKRDYAAAKKRADQSGGMRDSYIRDDVPMYKPAEGENVVRILPPTWDGAEHYAFDIHVHFGVGADNNAYLCPDRMSKVLPEVFTDSRCPICEERSEAARDGDKDYERKLRPVRRALCYIIDRDKPGDGVKAWPMPWTLDKTIMLQATDTRTQEYLEVDNPDEGYDISVNRTGTNERTEYGVRIARRATAVNLDDEVIDWLNNNPIPSILIGYEYDYIKRVFEGGSGGAATTAAKTATGAGGKYGRREVEEEEEDVRPARSTAGSGRRGAAAVVEEEEEAAPAKELPKPTWAELHQMQGEELDVFVEKYDLALNPTDFESDEELADAICKELGITNTRARPSSVTATTPARRGVTQQVAKAEEEEEEEGGGESEPQSESQPERASSSTRERLRGLRERHSSGKS